MKGRAVGGATPGASAKDHPSRRAGALRARTVRRWFLTGGFAAVAVVVGLTLAVSFHVGSSPEEVGAVVSPTEFLAHWQFVGSAASTTPTPLPRVWSATVGAPSHLGRVSASALLNAGASGDVAALWTFNATIGIAASTEIELAFSIQYVVGGVAHAVALTVYVETPARALPGTLTFSAYWDSGGTAAVTFESQLVVSQVCSAIGTCP